MVTDGGYLSVYAVGDVCVNREDPESIFALTSSTLNQADIVFCQLETTLSERGTPNPARWETLRSHPSNADAMKSAGFNVVSFASNHCMDWCADAFLDTIDNMTRNDMLVVGAGRNIAEARKPAIVESKGIRVAFLAYCSVLPPGYWAQDDKPGCAPMRAHTFYESVKADEPGQRCRVHTFAHPPDLEAIKEDIRKVRPLADVVIVSLHFGLVFVRAELAMYQSEVCHAAIDAGADLILGHHTKLIKGIEVYNGKVIFYSLPQFAFDLPTSPEFWDNPQAQLAMQVFGCVRDPEYPLFPFPVDSRKTMVAKAVISGKHITRVSLLPAFINKQNQPHILRREDESFAEVVKYLEEVTQEAGLDTTYSVEGDEVLIIT